MSIWKKLIGDKQFYKMVLAVALPVMIQNGITTFVNLLDNIMVGRIGTEQMSGIAIVNQIIFVFNLAVFGVNAATGIFGAQFFGSKNVKGIQDTFRLRIIISMICVTVGVTVLLLWGEPLILLFLHGEGNAEALAATLGFGKQYLMIMLVGLLPFAIGEAYASALRECGETKIPMIASVMAVCVNLVFNYLLIYGKFGFPKWGVVGAAAATALSRFVQMFFIIWWTHRNTEKMPFIVGVYRTMCVPTGLATSIVKTGIPIMINEILWGSGMAMMNQCYSTRGLDAVAAVNISTTIFNLCSIVYMAMGTAISIIVGQLLGAGKLTEARDHDTKLIAFSVFSCVLIGMVMVVLAPLFPEIYQTSDTVKGLATSILYIMAFFMPFYGFCHACYFTLRTGGKTGITFVFDSGVLWGFNIPFAFILSRYTSLTLPMLYCLCQMGDMLKSFVGFWFVKKGSWINNLVKDN